MSMTVNENWTSSSVKPVYTSGGNVIQTPKSIKKSKTKKKSTKATNKETEELATESLDLSSPTTCKFQGWSVEGIRQFNEIYDFIDKECKSDSGKKLKRSF